MNRRFLTALGAALLLVATLLPSATIAASPKGDRPFTKGGVYIVQLDELPVVAYDGRIAGLKATRAAPGTKVNRQNADVAKYAGHLATRHDAKLQQTGGRKLYDYTYSFNGFAAKLTAAQANKLARDKNVLAIAPDTLRTVDTSSTPAFLGLTAPGGLWAQLGGTRKAGNNIIIGVVDSGIWPESLSFSDRVNRAGFPSARGENAYEEGDIDWHGTCQTGEQFTRRNCNDKLIGARYFNAAWGGNAGIEAQRPWEFTSPRDYNGHGTHTSSTAGGNFGVQTTGPAAVFGRTSGIAPRARVAMYKALWSTEDASTASGFTSDLVEAIDAAVSDGVDVINYSISGTTTNFADPVEISFMFAAQAGVFVSESAGNSGPTTGTVAHPSPWTTTVAAGTHNRDGRGSATLGNGVTYNGASVATAVGPAPFIDSEAAGLPGANATNLRLCFSATDNGGTPVLDPAKVNGKIVLCDRGVNARVNKSLAVQEAGGVGMILTNTGPNSINADFHFVPTVHLADTDRAAVKAYAATAGATARINAATIVYDAPAPFTAAFSSRGPLAAGGGDLLKPDVIAPGQDILASVAPPGNAGRSFNLYSGTSMSAPHVAGLAALLKDLHPKWSPMAIKSAMMTSGSDVLDGPNTNPLVIFRQGAGHIRPNSAADPGLVFDSRFDDWRGFLAGQGLCRLCFGTTPATPIDASDFNVASIAIGDLAGVQTVHRTVTNVGSKKSTYHPTVTGMSGITVNVSPSSLSLKPGQKASFTVTFTRTTAALNAYTGGQLMWADGRHSVRLPMVIRPVALAAPAQVTGTGGPISYSVKFGYTGTFSATGRGLVAATTNAGVVAQDPGQSFSPGGPGTTSFDVVVPAGTTYARFSLFDAFTDGADDLDLYVYRGTTLVGASGGGTAQEEVNLVDPSAATYRVWVHGFDTDGPDSHFTLFNWVLGSTAAGNMTVAAPTTATTGATGTINLSFSGLAAGTKYLGSVAYAGSTDMPNPTIVRVDTP